MYTYGISQFIFITKYINANTIFFVQFGKTFLETGNLKPSQSRLLTIFFICFCYSFRIYF